MGGRGGSPYGKPGRLYMFEVTQEVDGKHYITGEIASTGGSNPASMFKEVGTGLFPSINWFFRIRSVSFFFHPELKQYVFGVRTVNLHWGTNSVFNSQEWTARARVKNEILNPNNHPIISLD